MTNVRSRLINTALVASLLIPAVATAQHNGDASSALSESVTATAVNPTSTPVAERAPAPSTGVRTDAAGPRADRLGVALRARTSDRAPAPVPVPRANTGHTRALMLVGVAAMVTGAVIGGDEGTIVMLGGAGIGLYGLYQFLR